MNEAKRCTRLSLGRKAGESIYIGDDINVTVAGVKGKHVTISITAPEDIVILRGELVPGVNKSTP